MLYTVIRKNSYQDSINLMLLTNAINTLDGVSKCSVMMGTDANKEILKSSGLFDSGSGGRRSQRHGYCRRDGG
ncbi:hypothetical protein [Propionivibrio sp.]|uniref:hypothetical protein n=1 Tax=Propionivibrio sp. TaxID=2212460 RepID=UPI0039E33C90